MTSPISLPITFPVACHTDNVGYGSTFVAIEGYADNGIRYIKKAIENGAHTIVVHHTTEFDDELFKYLEKNAIVIKKVDNTRKELALLSAQAADYPAQKLKIIGITGTKGKTTTSFLLEHILSKAGYKTALLSSAHNKICGTIFPATLTTPQPDYLHQFLKVCVEHDVEYVVMEVAAQALTLHRVEGIIFSGIIFTNFSHEHLEFYPTLQDYFNAKVMIFNQAAPHASILINADDTQCATLLAYAKPYSLKKIIDNGFCGLHSASQMNSVEITINYCKNNMSFTCPKLFGTYNAYNVLAATSMALALNISLNAIDNALQSFGGVPGRLQKYILRNGAHCFIDYAHNPESFSAVLITLRALTPHLVVVFGAGGGKDKIKRPMMGAIAAQIADLIIITSDNPRLEDVSAIVDDIKKGIDGVMFNKVIVELDRKKAIEYAYQLSNQNSIIALLGKGPDEYQIVGTEKIYFSERAIIEKL